MKLKSVDSSNIRAMGYKQGILVLQFHKENRIYLYYKVTHTVWMNFTKSKSKGKFFCEHIAGKFDYSQLEPLA